MNKPTDSTLVIIKISRLVTYIVYAFVIIAIVSLGFGFFLLLFGANPDTAFVKFVYNVAQEFLQPFRGIFPLKEVGTTGYFSASALFAIIVYLILAVALNSLISYITLKMAKHEEELKLIESKLQK